MAIFQVLKVVPPRKHQQSPRNFKQSQNEAKKKRERMVKQSQSKFKQSSRGNNLMKSKDITNMSLQEVLTSKKKISINLASKYRGPQECMGTTGKEGG
jgi:hypothetical protein